jgi:hypothetical protein
MWIKNSITYKKRLVSKLKALDVYAISKQRGFKLFFEEGFWNVFAVRILEVVGGMLSGWRGSSSDEMLLCPEYVLSILPSTRSPKHWWLLWTRGDWIRKGFNPVYKELESPTRTRVDSWQPT